MEIVVGGGGGERLYSQNLRDFLRIKEEDHQRNLNQSTSSSGGGGRRNPSGLTLSAVLSEKTVQPPPVDEPLQRIQSNRTLLDIIREDQTTGLGRGRGDGRSSWRHLTDKIRIRRRGSGSAVPTPSSEVSLNNNNNNNNRMMMTTRHPSIRFSSDLNSGESTQPDLSTLADIRGTTSHRNSSRATERASGRFEHTSSLPRRRLISEDNYHHENEEEEEERGGVTVEEEAEGDGSLDQPVRMSLMALLAENDRQMGFESSAYVMDEDAEDVDVETGAAVAVAVAAASVNGVEFNNCCVCMVRHKGAAFIPCGHTFCRLCSRELWVQRGNCPLCNNYILEILDIF